MALNLKKFFEGIVLKISTVGSQHAQEGAVYVDAADNKLKVYANAAAHKVVTHDQTETFTNKTFDADGTGNSISNIENADIKALAGIDATKIGDGSVTNAEFSYINGLTSDAQTQLNNNASSISNHLSDISDAHDASAISSIPSGNLAATEVQAALNELQSDVDSRALASDLSNHISDATDAHDASAISSVASGNLVATDVQSALNELQSDIDTRALASDLSNHISDATDAHDASAISSIPSGNLAATEVQAALNELQSDIDTRATSSALTTHTSASSAVHGITGSVVGTSDTQTLSNKGFSDALLLDQITTPATPASGKYKIYPKSGQLYGLNDSGVESAFAALDRAEIEKQVNLISNISIVTSVASNAMTVTLKSMDGSDLSASNFATILFRDPTVSSGSQIRRTITSNLSIVIPSGATLGFANAIETPFHVYAIDTGSGIELGVVRTQRMDNDVWSTTAISSSADSNAVFYSTNAQISKPVRLLARVISTQSTAGLWASNASKIQTIGLEPEFVLEKWSSNTGSYTTGSTLLYEDIRSSSHNAYDPSTGIFTAPRQGVLKINSKATLTSSSTSWSQLSIRNSGGTLLSAGPISTNIASLGSHYAVATYVAKVNQGDTFKISIGHGIGGSVSVDTSDTVGQYNSVEFIME